MSVLHESAIYYRFAGQSRQIGFPELHHILVERDQININKFMETLQLVQKVGLDNAGVIDVSVPRPSILMSAEAAKGLNLIRKAELVQEKGAPAYMIVGEVNLEHVVHAPLDEADKNLPTEAAKIISRTIRDVYSIPRISAQQLTQLLRHMKIDGDDHHCVYEKKLRRKYIARAGLSAVDEYIRRNPDEAISAFGSRAAKADYEARKKAKAEVS